MLTIQNETWGKFSNWNDYIVTVHSQILQESFNFHLLKDTDCPGTLLLLIFSYWNYTEKANVNR